MEVVSDATVPALLIERLSFAPTQRLSLGPLTGAFYGQFVRLWYERYDGPFSGPRSAVLDTVCSRLVFRVEKGGSGSVLAVLGTVAISRARKNT